MKKKNLIRSSALVLKIILSLKKTIYIKNKFYGKNTTSSCKNSQSYIHIYLHYLQENRKNGLKGKKATS